MNKNVIKPKKIKWWSVFAAAYFIFIAGFVLIIIYGYVSEKNCVPFKMVIKDSVILVDEFSNDIYSEDFTFDDGIIYRNELEFLLANYFLEIRDSNIFARENMYSFYETLFRDELFGGLEVKKGLKIKDSTLFFDEINSKVNMRLIDNVDTIFQEPEENEDFLDSSNWWCGDSELIFNYKTLKFECDF